MHTLRGYLGDPLTCAPRSGFALGLARVNGHRCAVTPHLLAFTSDVLRVPVSEGWNKILYSVKTAVS